MTLPVVPEVDDPDTDEALGQFVREMHNLESRLNFVGYSMLCNQWMLGWGMGDEVERARVPEAD